MKFSNVFLVILLSLATTFATATYINATGKQSASAAKESTYDRILRTGTIRCGYSVWDPLFFIDPKTNEKMGIFHDEMEEIGKRLGLKIVWQEELGWGTAAESVRTGRVDMACAGYWLNAGRIKTTMTSAPQIYSPLYVWIRQDDARSYNNPDDLNSDVYTVVNIDGSADRDTVVRKFPKAKILSLSEMATSSDEIENLVTKKADFLVSDISAVAPYLANNPGKIKNAFPNQPLNAFPNVMLLPADDIRLKQVIDDMARNIEYDGTFDAILKKYHTEHSYLRVPGPVKTAM